MSDVGDYFNDIRDAMKEDSRIRKRRNREKALKVLNENQIHFEITKGGVHLVVQSPRGELIDYWPSTGLFISRLDKSRGRGIHNLLNKVKV